MSTRALVRAIGQRAVEAAEAAVLTQHAFRHDPSIIAGFDRLSAKQFPRHVVNTQQVV
jgi:hypothetical protein